jgi:hypothetical protein
MQEYCNGPLIELAESFERVGVLELQLSGPKNACTAELSALVVAVANRLSPPRRR